MSVVKLVLAGSRMAPSPYVLCIVYRRVLKIPKHCVANVVCLENKGNKAQPGIKSRDSRSQSCLLPSFAGTD